MPSTAGPPGNARRFDAMVLLRVDLHEDLARSRSDRIEQRGFSRVAKRLPGPKPHSLADSRHVCVELIGEKEDLPPCGRRLRAPRRIDVEAWLPGHLDQIAVSSRPHPELAVTLAADGHPVGDERCLDTHLLAVLIHRVNGDGGFLLHDDYRDAEGVGR